MNNLHYTVKPGEVVYDVYYGQRSSGLENATLAEVKKMVQKKGLPNILDRYDENGHTKINQASAMRRELEAPSSVIQKVAA